MTKVTRIMLKSLVVEQESASHNFAILDNNLEKIHGNFLATD